MCGIVGMVTVDKFNLVDKRKFLSKALIIDTLRGEDSTGIFYHNRDVEANKDNTAGWCKEVVDGYKFVNSKNYRKAMESLDDRWFVVGHNRAATVGAVDVAGAHPFQEGAITMVHNGTLTHTNRLQKTQSELGVAVDSHAICHNLALAEPDKAHEVFTKLDGAFALVWHDARDGSLNFVRNSQRPLHFGKYQNTLYFASESGQLQYLNDKLSLGITEILYPEPGVHMKFKSGEILPEVNKHNLIYGTGSWGRNAAYWEDYDDYSNYSDSTPASKPHTSTPPRETVLVGGSVVKIPDRSIELLAAHKLSPSDRFVMTPIKKYDNSSHGNRVMGHIQTLDMGCVIYHINKLRTNAGWNRKWLVRPIAVKCATSTDKKPLIICTVVNTDGLAQHERYSWWSVNNDKTEKGGATGTHMYPIHGHTYVTRQKFLDETKDGCTYCNNPIYAKDAEQIDWVGDAPLCVECSICV